MKRLSKLAFMTVLALASLMIISGCTPELKPDLVPVNPDNWVNFCDVDDSGNLLVHVKNQGTEMAGPSTLRVDFGQYGSISEPVPSLLVGDIADIPISIPFGCFDPDCGFEITVDSTNAIDESDEGNNTQTGGLCIG